VPPDQRGLIHENDVKRLKELGEVNRKTFKTNLAKGALVDGKAISNWSAPSGSRTRTITLDLHEPKTFNMAMLQEKIELGQRIESVELDALVGDKWTTIAKAETIGYKRLLRFPLTTSSKVRIRITGARLEPTLSNFGLFRSPAILRAPTIRRQKDGKVVISAEPGIEVRYTLDGTKPTSKSERYGKPFAIPDGATVRACAIGGKDTVSTGGVAESQATFGYSKAKWRIHYADSEEPVGNSQASMAIDEDPSTYWHTQWASANPGYPHELVIDLGEKLELGGLGYLPRQDGTDGGLVAKYQVFVSDDPANWGNPVAEGEFGNVLNNPILQRVTFTKPASGKYVRFVALASPNGKPWAGAAEIDLFPVANATKSR